MTNSGHSATIALSIIISPSPRLRVRCPRPQAAVRTIITLISSPGSEDYGRSDGAILDPVLGCLPNADMLTSRLLVGIHIPYSIYLVPSTYLGSNC